VSKPIFKTFLWLSFTLAGPSLAFGQDLDMDCRPIPLPTACQPIAAQLAALEGRFELELRRLRNLMVHVSSSQRAEILQMIEDLQQERAGDLEIARLANELQACKNANNQVPRRPVSPAVLDAVFTGTVTTRVFQPSQPPTQTVDPITIGLQFSRNRCNVTITSFPPINSANSVVVTKTGGGSGKYFPVSGAIEMPLSLAFDIPVVTDASADTDLTTGSKTSASGLVSGNGFPLSRDIDTCVTSGGCLVALFGTTIFRGGPVDAQEGSFRISGTISAPPAAPPPPGDARLQCLNSCDDAFLSCLERSADRGGPSRAACAAQRGECRSKCPQ
jgi:hypothetical protein